MRGREFFGTRQQVAVARVQPVAEAAGQGGGGAAELFVAMAVAVLGANGLLEPFQEVFEIPADDRWIHVTPDGAAIGFRGDDGRGDDRHVGEFLRCVREP